MLFRSVSKQFDRRMCRQVFEPKSSELLIDVSNRWKAEVGVGFEKFKKLGQPFAHGLRGRLLTHARILANGAATYKLAQPTNVLPDSAGAKPRSCCPAFTRRSFDALSNARRRRRCASGINFRIEFIARPANALRRGCCEDVDD